MFRIGIQEIRVRRKPQIMHILSTNDVMYEIGKILFLRKSAQLIRIAQPHIEYKICILFLQRFEKLLSCCLIGT